MSKSRPRSNGTRQKFYEDTVLMKSSRTSPIIAWLTMLSLVLSLTAGIMMGDRAYAATSSAKVKVSADLSKKVKDLPSGSRVTVIVRSSSSWSSTLDNAVKGYGG